MKADLKYAENVTKNVLLALIFLFLLKFLVGTLTQSPVLIADALHSVVDASALFACYIGLKLASKPSSERFPYGYYKAESLAALFISLLILLGAFELGKNAISEIFNLGSIQETNTLPALFVAGFSAVFSFFIARMEEKAAKRSNSQALHASSKESMIDVLSSFLVFGSLVFSKFGIMYAQPLCTVVIVVLVVKMAFENLYQSILALMDISPSRELEMNVIKAIGKISGIEGFEELKLRKAGPFVFGEVTLKIRKSVSVERAHEISKILEHKIKSFAPEIEAITIRIEPYEPERQIVAIPVEENLGLNSRISPKLGRAKGFIIAFVDTPKRKIVSYEYAENPFADEKTKAGLKTTKFLVNNYRINAIIVKDIGEIAFHILHSNLIDVFKAKGRNVLELIENFASGKLEMLNAPTREGEEK